MGVINLNHAQILSSVLHKKPEDINVVALDATATARDGARSQAAASLSVIVKLSDEAERWNAFVELRY